MHSRKQSDGFYHIHGHKYANLVGSRAQVFHGTAYKTSGLLTKKDLVRSRHDRIVSRVKHDTMKRDNGKNLGPFRLAKKGDQFGPHEKGPSSSSRRCRTRRRGGRRRR